MASELVLALIGRATKSEFTAALLYHQQRAVSSGEGAACENWGFACRHTLVNIVVPGKKRSHHSSHLISTELNWTADPIQLSSVQMI